MRSPRPGREGTTAEDSDWEPSDGEEGDSPPGERAHDPLRPAAIQAARRRLWTRSGRRGRAVRGRRQMEMLGRAAASFRGRGVTARARPAAAQTARIPRWTMSARRARPATAFRRPSARGSPVSSSLAHPQVHHSLIPTLYPLSVCTTFAPIFT
jgi:hypothetical protein